MMAAAQPTEFAAVPDEMLAEAREIVGAAAGAGVVLRLVGGLAVYATSPDRDFARRPIRDIDLVGLRRQAKRVAAALGALGYQENRHVRFATAGQVMQFFRQCVHVGGDGRRAHDDDRIDVYLDAFRLDHEIALKDRLPRRAPTPCRPPTCCSSSCSARALPRRPARRGRAAQGPAPRRPRRARRGQPRLPGAAVQPRLVPAPRRDRQPAPLPRAASPSSAWTPAQQARVAAALDEIEAAIAARTKTLRWRLRSIAGERLPWTDMRRRARGPAPGAARRRALESLLPSLLDAPARLSPGRGGHRFG